MGGTTVTQILGYGRPEVVCSRASKTVHTILFIAIIIIIIITIIIIIIIIIFIIIIIIIIILGLSLCLLARRCVTVVFVTPHMKRYPMMKMELLAQWYRVHVKEYNETKISEKFLVVSKI